MTDVTSTAAWTRLAELHDALTPDLRGWFAADPERGTRFARTAGDLYVDLSKNLVTDEVLDALVQLADEIDLAGRRDAMYAGERINTTENRSVLHTALRRPTEDVLSVDGQDVVADVHATLAKVYAFADRVRSGDWTGATGKPIATVVNIGIGGSDLGPVMVYEALKPYVAEGLECRSMLHNGAVFTVELPNTVELEVVECAPCIKGATAQAQLKAAKLETGIEIQVPPYLEAGERVRVDTRDGRFVERVR